MRAHRSNCKRFDGLESKLLEPSCFRNTPGLRREFRIRRTTPHRERVAQRLQRVAGPIDCERACLSNRALEARSVDAVGGGVENISRRRRAQRLDAVATA